MLNLTVVPTPIEVKFEDVPLTLIKVKFEDVPLEQMRSILNGLDLPYVDPMVELHAMRQGV